MTMPDDFSELTPEVITVTDEQWDAFMALLDDDPQPEPDDRLIRLFTDPRPNPLED